MHAQDLNRLQLEAQFGPLSYGHYQQCRQWEANDHWLQQQWLEFWHWQQYLLVGGFGSQHHLPKPQGQWMWPQQQEQQHYYYQQQQPAYQQHWHQPWQP